MSDRHQGSAGRDGGRPLVPFARPSDPPVDHLEPYIWSNAASGHTVPLFTVF